LVFLFYCKNNNNKNIYYGHFCSLAGIGDMDNSLII
jgi:hypothetical protein